MTANAITCRACGAHADVSVIDLGSMPPANSYVEPHDNSEERRYPLHVRVCPDCLLVQIADVISVEDLFTDYAYFSSYSESWLAHCRRFADAARRDLRLTAGSLVVEVASNDGYLLQHFQALGIPVLGIEPAKNVAAVAIEKGIPTETTFFGAATANELVNRGVSADLLVANNVLAHVPDLHDFVEGMALVLKPGGVISIEVPHLLRLIEEVQFDTIYHEHFSYFSLLVVERVLSSHSLRVFDVEQLPTHGGSVRIWACASSDDRRPSPRLLALREDEQRGGMHRVETFTGFGERVERCRRSVVEFVTDAKAQGKSIVAYGAAAKGNTLLNFCGLATREIDYVVDRSPHKQGRFLPGSRLPIEPPSRVAETQPDYLLILAWNLRDEIMGQMAYIRDWGGRFLIPVPTVQVYA